MNERCRACSIFGLCSGLKAETIREHRQNNFVMMDSNLIEDPNAEIIEKEIMSVCPLKYALNKYANEVRTAYRVIDKYSKGDEK